VLNGATLAVAGGITVAEPLTLNGTGVDAAGALVKADTLADTLTGPITLASDSSIGMSTAVGSLTVSGVIDGPGALTKVGAGASGLILQGANTYTGATTVSAGILIITSSTALGSPAAGTTVQDGAELQVAGGITVAEPLILNGSGIPGHGALEA